MSSARYGMSPATPYLPQSCQMSLEAGVRWREKSLMAVYGMVVASPASHAFIERVGEAARHALRASISCGGVRAAYAEDQPRDATSGVPQNA